MKGVPIKFRGVRADNGEMVSGWYVPFERNPLEFSIRDRLQGFFVYHYYGHGIIDSDFKIHAVNPETISQFVGYDAAGEEVYEGDEMNCYRGFCLPADELKKKKIEKVSRVKLVARVTNCGYEDLNAPFDYQFLRKGR